MVQERGNNDETNGIGVFKVRVSILQFYSPLWLSRYDISADKRVQSGPSEAPGERSDGGCYIVAIASLLKIVRYAPFSRRGRRVLQHEFLAAKL